MPFAGAAASASDLDAPVEAGPPSADRSRRRFTAAAIVGLMIVMAAISLTVGLQTVQRRRAWDPKEPLSYLPADSNVVGSMRAAPLLQEPSGRQFIDNLRLGPISFGFDSLERWTGLKRSEIHALAAGLATNDRLLPRVVLVIQTEKPYDEDQARRNVGDAEPVNRGQKTLYRFPIGEGGLRGTAWYAAKSIVVVGLSPEDFDSVPDQPTAGIGQFSAPIQAALRDRIGAGADAWIVGDADHWDKSLAGAWLARRFDRRSGLLTALRTFALSLHFDENTVRLHGACALADAAGAQVLKDYLATTRAGDAHIDEDRWVLWSFTANPDTLDAGLKDAFSGFGSPLKRDPGPHVPAPNP